MRGDEASESLGVSRLDGGEGGRLGPTCLYAEKLVTPLISSVVKRFIIRRACVCVCARACVCACGGVCARAILHSRGTIIRRGHGEHACMFISVGVSVSLTLTHTDRPTHRYMAAAAPPQTIVAAPAPSRSQSRSCFPFVLSAPRHPAPLPSRCPPPSSPLPLPYLLRLARVDLVLLSHRNRHTELSGGDSSGVSHLAANRSPCRTRAQTQGWAGQKGSRKRRGREE